MQLTSYGDGRLLPISASTYRGHEFVNTRYLILSNADSNISSVNWLGTRLRVLEVLEILDPLMFESMLAGRSSVFSHGHTTCSLSVGEIGSVGLALRFGI